MRLVLRIDLHHIQPYAAICAALITMAPITGAHAQQSATTASSDAGSVTLASLPPAAATAPVAVASNSGNDNAADSTADNTPPASSSQLAADALSGPADAVAATDPVLDDQALSQQRGGFSGLFMVAATPQLMRVSNSGNGNGVTLWDEIAPPSQVPIPVDVARSAQGNLTTYQRN
jgi:hypothetical protein